MTFRPKPLVTLGAFVGILLLCGLGTWQLTRYRQKVALEEVREKNVQLAPVAVSSLAQLQGLNYRRISVSGQLLPAYSVLFKHRTYKQLPGFWLVQPLRLDGGGVLLVNRGWLPFDRGVELAERERTSAPSYRTLTGLFYVLPQNLPDFQMRQRLKAAPQGLQGSLTQWDRYDLSGVYDALPYDHLQAPGVLVLEATGQEKTYPLPSTAYVTKPYMTSDRHMSYFIFWYTCAAALLGLYLAASFGVIGSFGKRQRPQTL